MWILLHIYIYSRIKNLICEFHLMYTPLTSPPPYPTCTFICPYPLKYKTHSLDVSPPLPFFFHIFHYIYQFYISQVPSHLIIPQTPHFFDTKMKIQCDVCHKSEAVVYCAADEASLCSACDHRVHHANKLANKHPRFSLMNPSFKDSPRCDICQVCDTYQ